MAILKLKKMRPGNLVAYLAVLCAGLVIGHATKDGWAKRMPPTEHKGVSVAGLGVVPEASLAATIGLNGYIMQLREITLEPGGR